MKKIIKIDNIIYGVIFDTKNIKKGIDFPFFYIYIISDTKP